MPIRLLLCDDHAVFTEGLASVIPGDEVEVVATVSRVRDLLEATVRTQPDVVLMDYQLPDGDGVSAIRMLTERHPDVKVVMLTSATDEEVLVGALQAGATGFVTKHESSTRVLEAVKAAAEGRVVVSSEVLAHLLPRVLNTGTEPAALTSREREVLALMADGASSPEIGERLFISRNTVRTHVQAILTKLGAHSRLEAVVIATKAGLVPRATN